MYIHRPLKLDFYSLNINFLRCVDVARHNLINEISKLRVSDVIHLQQRPDVIPRITSGQSVQTDEVDELLEDSRCLRDNIIEVNVVCWVVATGECL